MPFIDLPFRLKPIGQVAPVFATAPVPKFIRSLGNLFFQAYVLVHMEDWRGVFWICGFFHKHGCAIVTAFSKGKTVATHAKEVAVAVAGGFDARKELMCGMGAAVITFGIVLMLLHRHTCARRFADVQRCAIAAEYFYRRPLRQHRNRCWCVRSKFFHCVNNLAADDGKDRFDAFDLFLWHGKIIIGERNQVRQLTGGNPALLSALIRKPTAALCVKPQSFFAAGRE
jgi:hypothetical protein